MSQVSCKTCEGNGYVCVRYDETKVCPSCRGARIEGRTWEEPYASPAGYHRHKCKFCTPAHTTGGYVWEHHDVNDVKHGRSGAHECPFCGRCNWSLGVYEGTEAPQEINGEIPAGGETCCDD